MRLIDADALFDQIRLQANRSSLGETRTPEISGLEVISLIKEAPAVDAESVRHGRWVKENIRKKSYLRLCTACEKVCYFCGTGCSYKYCPNCGAKMDGGAEDENA